MEFSNSAKTTNGYFYFTFWPFQVIFHKNFIVLVEFNYFRSRSIALVSKEILETLCLCVFFLENFQCLLGYYSNCFLLSSVFSSRNGDKLQLQICFGCFFSNFFWLRSIAINLCKMFLERFSLQKFIKDTNPSQESSNMRADQTGGRWPPCIKIGHRSIKRSLGLPSSLVI